MSNLDHALDDACDDPDCEIHQPEVALKEGTCSQTELAYYVAGLLAGAAAGAERATARAAALAAAARAAIPSTEA